MGPNRIEVNFHSFREVVLQALNKISIDEIKVKNSKLAQLAKDFLQTERKRLSFSDHIEFKGSAHDGLSLAAEKIRQQNSLSDDSSALLSEIISEGAKLFSEALIEHLKGERKKEGGKIE